MSMKVTILRIAHSSGGIAASQVTANILLSTVSVFGLMPLLESSSFHVDTPVMMKSVPEVGAV